MGNITNICSCIYLNQDKKNSNIKINSFNNPYPNHLHMKPSDNTVNMVESTDASLLSNILQTSEQFPEPKMHFIESYNSKNNFFYYLSKIKTIQRFYKKRFQFKQTLKLPLKTQKTVKQIFIADIDNEGEERVIDSEEIEVGAFNKFNYEEFQHHISCMDNIMKLSLITENDFDQVLTPKVALKAKPEGIMKKKTKDFVRAIVKRQTVNKKNQLTIPNQEECSLTNYITTCQASFKSINKLTIILNIECSFNKYIFIMGEYIQLVSQDKKNIYLPKKVAELSEYMRKEIESNTLYTYVLPIFKCI